MKCLLAAILLQLVATLWGCSDAAQFGSRPEEHIESLTAGFEYRWGDSPFDAGGKPLWASESPAAPGWIHQSFPEWPKDGPPGAVNLWQRVRLPALADDHQTLHLLGAWRLFEVYLDGQKIYHYGRIGADGRGYFPGQVWHWIDLPQSASGKFLYFRFFSDDAYKGLFQAVHVGTRTDHMIWMVKRDIALIMMGSIYIFVGLITIFLFSRNRSERINFSFGTFAIVIGTYEFSRTYLKQFFIYDPLFWTAGELLSLYMVPLTFAWVAEHLLGVGPWRLVRRIRIVNGTFVIWACGRALLSSTSLWDSLPLFQDLLLVQSFIFIGLIGRAAKTSRNVEARVFFAGVCFVTLGAVHDVLVSLAVIKGAMLVNHIGVFLFISSLAAIVGRRYFLTIAIRKNIELASAVQNLLLPKQSRGHFGQFEYSSYYEPHGSMSGDWMNFWQAGGEQRLLFGDVIGKGPRAALAVAAISAFIENAKESGDTLEACIHRINSGLFNLFDSHITTTLSAVSLHADGTVELFNSGGIGWVKLGKKSEHIPMPSSILGGQATANVAHLSLQLNAGEFVFSFTDGVLEGARALHRLTRAFTAWPRAGRDFPYVFQTAMQFGSATVHADDRSIVAVRRPA